ncbi:MAG: DsrE family protein [Thermodesulfobacteriota bacterium]
MNNKTLSRLRVVSVFTFICLFSIANPSYGGEYGALEGLDDIKVVFDIRAPKAKTAAIYLDLIHQTFKDKNIREVSKQPDFAVVFAGGIIKLLSSDTTKFSAEEKKEIERIAGRVAAMKKDGIKMEVCLFAANLLGVAPESILADIEQVPNGWISLIGYQARGHSLVSAF